MLITAVLLVALGWWTYSAVERSLHELRAATLTAMLEAQVRSLGIWRETHQISDGQFATIVSAVRTGETGEAYAFDRAGNLLSGGRFGNGVTPLADLARKSTDGVMLDPYPSYHGGAVIGVWRWLPEYDIGVAVEMGAAEAYEPMRYLNVAFGIVFGILAIAVFAALAGAVTFARLRSQGPKVGAYRLGERIGEGGMANVYLARHDLLKRPTAVKILKLTRMSDEIVARFGREVQLASSLSHPNTIEIFDYGHTRDGRLYYAMEYLDGLNVGQLVERDRYLPVARCIHLLRQVCAALAEAHGKGLVHRDIKPENVMACRHGGIYDFVKILDFGLVKNVAEEHSRDLTRNLRILGTPLYMAPERLRNPGDVDARADIYAVGALGYLMLTGARLFEAGNDLELTSRILNDEPPRPAASAPQRIPVELDLLIFSCVEKRREDRPQRVTDLVEAFDALALEHRWTQAQAELWWSAVPKDRK